jgi:hypothetical protein
MGCLCEFLFFGLYDWLYVAGLEELERDGTGLSFTTYVFLLSF